MGEFEVVEKVGALARIRACTERGRHSFRGSVDSNRPFGTNKIRKAGRGTSPNPCADRWRATHQPNNDRTYGGGDARLRGGVLLYRVLADAPQESANKDNFMILKNNSKKRDYKKLVWLSNRAKRIILLHNFTVNSL